jgi:hypothetical protein
MMRKAVVIIAATVVLMASTGAKAADYYRPMVRGFSGFRFVAPRYAARRYVAPRYAALPPYVGRGYAPLVLPFGFLVPVPISASGLNYGGQSDNDDYLKSAPPTNIEDPSEDDNNTPSPDK